MHLVPFQLCAVALQISHHILSKCGQGGTKAYRYTSLIEESVRFSRNSGLGPCRWPSALHLATKFTIVFFKREGVLVIAQWNENRPWLIGPFSGSQADRWENFAFPSSRGARPE